MKTSESGGHYPKARNISAIAFCFLVSLISSCYLYWIRRGGGGDFYLRLAEARYFTLGINPYSVYIGAQPAIEGMGRPNVYSYVSYIFLSPLALLRLDVANAYVFMVFELILLIFLAVLLQKHFKSSWSSISVGLALILCSVFFMQHIRTLNYNVVVATALLTSLWAVSRKRMLIFLATGFLVGLKPTVLIPLLITLFLRGKRREGLALVVLLLTSLIAVCAYLTISPIEYMIQLSSTSEEWSKMSNLGLLSAALFLGIQPNTIVSVMLTSIVTMAATRLSDDTAINNYAIVAFASLAFFYNNVHAWIIVFPVFVVWLEQFQNHRSQPWTGIILASFLLIPKLEGIYPESVKDLILLGHNIVRFGTLGIAIYLFLANSMPPCIHTVKSLGSRQSRE